MKLENYEIKTVKLRADRKSVKSLFINGKRLTKRDTIEFDCQKCGKHVQTIVQHFLVRPELTCSKCARKESRKNWKFPEASKKLISEKKKGVLRNTDYFDFTCPVCDQTFKYRNIKRNRKKKYCSRECQKKVWVRSPEYKGEMNLLETYFATILDEMKIEYEAQHMIRYNLVDFYLPEHNIIIQIDGDWWHVNPNKHPEGAISDVQKQNLKVDEEFNKYIEETDYKLIRIWESEIREDLEKVKNKIKKALN